MELGEAFRGFQDYDLWLVVIGLALLAAAALPRLLSEDPISMPLVLFGFGFAVVTLPFGLAAPDPLEQGAITEHLTELGVIVALMGAGLKIDRRPSLRGWATTWRLLGITMVLTIAAAAFLGWRLAAFVPATAALFGAVIAPTDPVLASEVQVGSPGKGSEDAESEELDPEKTGQEDEVRFALTSEAGLNDGLAFPFTNLAVAMALAGAHPDGWFATWVLVDVLYKLVVGLIGGIALGYVLGAIIYRIPAKTEVAKVMSGFSAVAATLILYGLTDFTGGYGFIAVFVGAIMLRHHRGEHPFHVPMFLSIEKMERLLTAVILIALGGAVAGGILAPLTWPLVLTALLVFFVVRPLAGIIGLLGLGRHPWRERLFISFFGIRGIGSLYYLSFALNHATFEGERELWAVVGLVIVLSIVLHGTTAAPLTSWLDRLRAEEPGTRRLSPET